MESPLSFFRMHWDHELTPSPSQEGSSTPRPVPLPERGQGWVCRRRFIERTPAAAGGALGRTPLQRAFEDLTQLVHGEFNGIGLHAVCLQGWRDNPWRVVGGDSIPMEVRDFQVRTEVLDPDDSFSGPHAITADEQPSDVVVTTQRLA